MKRIHIPYFDIVHSWDVSNSRNNLRVILIIEYITDVCKNKFWVQYFLVPELQIIHIYF